MKLSGGCDVCDHDKNYGCVNGEEKYLPESEVEFVINEMVEKAAMSDESGEVLTADMWLGLFNKQLKISVKLNSEFVDLQTILKLKDYDYPDDGITDLSGIKCDFSKFTLVKCRETVVMLADYNKLLEKKNKELIDLVKNVMG